MTETATETVLTILQNDFEEIVDAWISTQSDEGVQRTDLFSHKEGREQTSALVRALVTGIEKGATGDRFDLASDAWSELRNVLVDVTQERSERGVTPSDMASFVLALKAPVFYRLKDRLAKYPANLVEEIWLFTRVVDAFAVYCTEVFIAERDRIIEQQRDQMQELSTPVVELWDKVLTLPLIGTMDSARAQEVMENLLETILQRQAEVVIVDLTGVQTVDTQVAQHMLRMAAAVRLMGAECIISGISPTIAQTMVQLGVDVGEVTTRSTIRNGLADALSRIGYEITKKKDH
ncbi:STAS domain-containing protein [Phaeobacter porticola]|uniref:Stressosome protein rsbRA-like protein n=1 Tax=Phaeobacter porticola TaxID=1844006 RepID=A0A1L3IA90_9RHOB|nr:STAS domain-containing protein [Phaeobacter porticola]APG48972.1 stressosome protein rsbRA-like protein [Phaeobacter porticola]